MRKIVFLFAFVSVLAGALYARDDGKALGLRLGYDAQEISYQQSLGMTNRLEVTLGVNTFDHNQAGKLCRGAGLNGIYQRVYDLSSVMSGLNVYGGVGVAAVLHGEIPVIGGQPGIGILGQIGIGYNFNYPLQLSLDYRPGAYWLPGAGNIYRFSWNAPCLAIRYRF